MKLFSENKNYKLYQGNMLDMLEVIEPNTIDSIVCDPPYELNFMGKGWDNSGIAFQSDTWKKCFSVLKPGGYLLAFGGSRTFHRIACAIEDAGFEIRDTIMWLYGSGFPKSMSLGKVIEGKKVLGSANVRDIKKLDGKKEIVGGGWNSNEVEQGKRNKEYEQIKTNVNYTTELGKKWQGWGTALKPSFEPIIVARKPFKGSLVDNVIEYGVGGLNIDECRVDYNGEIPNIGGRAKHTRGEGYGFKALEENCIANTNGRFPANTILTYDETNFNEVCGGFPNTKSQKRSNKYNKLTEYTNTYTPAMSDYREDNTYNDSGSASRYFYCAKTSKKDRDEGLEGFEEKNMRVEQNREIHSAGCEYYENGKLKQNPHLQSSIKRNFHPTVKPTELMQYLVRLVTPNNGTILDPFNGSGSTGKAVMYENKEKHKDYKYIGIELTEEYLPIAKARIEYVCNLKEEKPDKEQLSLFDIIEEE